MPPTVLQHFMFSDSADEKPYWTYHKRLEAEYGIKQLRMLAHVDMFPPDDRQGVGPIDKVLFRRRLEGIDAEQTPIGMLNLEGKTNWGYYGRQFNQAALDTRVDCMQFAKQVRPDIKFGLFRESPVSYFDWAMGGLVENARWVLACEQLRPEAELADFIIPCIYPLRSWGRCKLAVEYAKRIIEVSGIYGKPVIPIVWMEFYDLWKLWVREMRAQGIYQKGTVAHPTWYHTPDPNEWANLKARLIPRKYWRRLLGTILKLTKGKVILWGGEGSPCWCEKFPFWTETKKLAVKYGVAPTRLTIPFPHQ